jgi:hypothetical protein
VLNVAEQVGDDGVLQAALQATYLPPPRDAAPASAGASR